MMTIPNDTEIFETPLSTLWLDKKGILYSVTKKTNWTKAHYDEVLKVYARLAKDGKKLCILSDISNTKDLESETREYILTKAHQYIKASAILSETALKPSITNVVIKLNMNSFPVRMFQEKESAIRWLKTYL